MRRLKYLQSCNTTQMKGKENEPRSELWGTSHRARVGMRTDNCPGVSNKSLQDPFKQAATVSEREGALNYDVRADVSLTVSVFRLKSLVCRHATGSSHAARDACT